jgi:hypothetical protein
MLRVWFSSFVPSEHGVEMTAPLQVCTKDRQQTIVRLLGSERMKGAETHRQLAAIYGQNEVCTSGSKCLKAAEPVLLMLKGKDTHPHPQTNKT